MKTLGIHHLGLSVVNLDSTTAFFVDCLGWTVVREIPDYPAKFVSNGEAFFTLWQTSNDAKPFDRKNQVGLHHVAINVASEEDLLEVYDRISQFQNVVIEFAPELLGDGPAQHCMVYEPSGIRIEIIWAP